MLVTDSAFAKFFVELEYLEVIIFCYLISFCEPLPHALIELLHLFIWLGL